MPFDGNGNWTSNFSAVADRDANIKILASRFDGILLADIAQSFENCLTKDTQVKPQQPFNANNYRMINVSNPVNATDAVNLQTVEGKDALCVHKAGTETITGDKTFSSTITGNISGNAGTVTNGVYTTGNQTIGGTKTFSSTISGSITGNAGTATTLQTARTINGTSFNGSANITTSSWGNARNVSISDADATNTGTAVSVNGSSAVTLKLPSTIKASLTGNASTVTNGVYTTGNQTIGGTKTFSNTISGSITGNAGTVTNGVYTNTEQTITGNKTFSGSVNVTTQNSSDSSTKAASTAFVKNVLGSSGNGLATISKNQNGYCKFDCGLIIQWGYATGSGTVTLPIPFSDANYGVCLTRSAANGTNDNDAITTTRAASFDVTIYQGGGGHWIAIGY